ncbi:MAG: winged helix-turn-helix domain-containing protein [Phycisphaerales bacterium]|nr:winged helix-turn-helix domain-containing protein [Phycisphaerales bacterium]
MTTKKTNKKSGKKKAGAPRSSAKTTKGPKVTPGASPTKGQSTTKPGKTERPKRTSGLDLAAEVLTKAGTPLNAKAIAERVIEAGWNTSGLTPAATLYSAIQREIAKKGSASRFKKVDRGQFTINDAGTTK